MIRDRFLKPAGLLGSPYSAAEFFFGYLLCGAMIVFTMFWVTTEVIARFGFSYSFKGLVDVVCLLVTSITFIALAALQRTNSHIRMDLFDAKLSASRAGIIVKSIILLLSALVAGILCYAIAKYTLMVYTTGRATMLIYMPYWPFAALVSIGLFFLVVRLCMQVKDYLWEVFGKYGAKQAEQH